LSQLEAFLMRLEKPRVPAEEIRSVDDELHELATDFLSRAISWKLGPSTRSCEWARAFVDWDHQEKI